MHSLSRFRARVNTFIHKTENGNEIQSATNADAGDIVKDTKIKAKINAVENIPIMNNYR